MSGVLKRFCGVVLSVFLAAPALAQDLGALARFQDGGVEDTWSGAQLRLELSQGVPWRVFTLTQPNRLIMDFREVVWGDTDPQTLIDSDRVRKVRVGSYRPGWSRLVAELAEPMVIDTAELVTDATTGSASIWTCSAARCCRSWRTRRHPMTLETTATNSRLSRRTGSAG